MPPAPAFSGFDNTLRLWTEWNGAGRFFAVFGVTLVAVWIVKRILFRALARYAATAGTANFDDTLLGALRWPARYWVVLTALVVAISGLDEADVPARILHALSVTTVVLLAVSLSIAVARVSIVLLQHSMRRSPTGIQITTVNKLLIRLFWALPAVLVVLHELHIDLTFFLTTLGVGGIAISLALKDGLANVFSGFYVSASGQLHKDDYIKLDDGVEGYVIDIHWRITTLRTLQNNLVLIPNSKLSEAVVYNYSQPAKPLSVGIAYGVGYDTDIDRLDALVLETARAAIGAIPGLLDTPAPVNRLSPGFGDSALQFTLYVTVAEFERQYAVADQLRRRLLAAFQREGIVMPYPTRTVTLVNPPTA
jgi:small-conductance mechanosensitive channel